MKNYKEHTRRVSTFVFVLINYTQWHTDNCEFSSCAANTNKMTMEETPTHSSMSVTHFAICS